MSVPFTTVTTYTERASLSVQLEEKLGRPSRGKKLAHAVTVTGLGGTGKTQLVLRYIEKHEKEYDCILWIDARSEETARSSFERCCRAIGLPIEHVSGPGRIQDSPAVQAVLQWLRGGAATRKWMVVVDNADQLNWGVERIVPAGEAGSVIVTSQDGHASQLVGRRSEVVVVEGMNPDEACSLLLKAVDKERESASEELLDLSKRIVDILDRLPLAVDLAMARIGSDVDDSDEAQGAMRRYLADFQGHQDRLLQSNEYIAASQYDQTVWTVWEASLTSLRGIEDGQQDIRPVAFLTLLTLLDRANIQTELFRLASGGVQEARAELNVDLPLWLQKVLAQGEDEKWDDFYYRETIKPLIRFGLVRWTQGAWPGLTMHGLVRWRAAKERDETACWRWYTTFCTAACVQKSVEAGTAEFRRHMLVHLPPIERLLTDGDQSGERDVSSMWTHVGIIWEDEGRWDESEELFFAAQTGRTEKLGEEHPSTLTAMANLASTYRKQGRWKKAEELEVKVMEATSRVLGEEHPSTLTAMANLASTYWNQGRWKEAEELEVKVMEARSKVLGEEHPSTLTAMANLAHTLRDLGQYKMAFELMGRSVTASTNVLGEGHPKTIERYATLAVWAGSETGKDDCSLSDQSDTQGNRLDDVPQDGA